MCVSCEGALRRLRPDGDPAGGIQQGEDPASGGYSFRRPGLVPGLSADVSGVYPGICGLVRALQNALRAAAAGGG
ncbi:hypothetical protein D3C80_2207800 [compost metagenome]